VAYGAGVYVAGGRRYDGSNFFAQLSTSPDGITWTSQATEFGSAGRMYGLAYGDKLYVAVGDDGALTTSPAFFETAVSLEPKSPLIELP
jgi:hypothetical protein